MKLIIALLFFVFCHFSIAQNKEELFVRKCFENYKQAILADQGENAIKFVDKKTINYYTKMLDKIKKADSLEVNSLGIIDKIMVLSIRHQASKKEIQSMNGPGLLVYAIQKGMIGKSSVQRNRIGEVKLKGDMAKGQIVSGEQITPVYFDFNKEKGVWKIDLTSVFSLGTIGFKQVLKKSGLKENEYLIQVLEQMNGKKPSTKIWNPSL